MTITTPEQLAANRANAQLSTGPRSAEGKAASSLNNFRHGLTGAFRVLDWEDEDAFGTLQTMLLAEHKPEGTTEIILVDNMVRHQWLLQRAFRLQENCFNPHTGDCDDPNRLALYLRYQTTNERAFFHCLAELKRLQTARRKAVQIQQVTEIGFESQQRKSQMQGMRLELLHLKLAKERNKSALLSSNNLRKPGDLAETPPPSIPESACAPGLRWKTSPNA